MARETTVSLKKLGLVVEELYSMLKIKLTDGSELEVLREEVNSIIPISKMLRHSHLLSTGLIYHGGKVVPVAGPVDFERLQEVSLLPVEERTWILYLGNHAYVISGFPQFDDDIVLSKHKKANNVVELPTAAVEEVAEPNENELSEEERVLKEMEELLKTA